MSGDEWDGWETRGMGWRGRLIGSAALAGRPKRPNVISQAVEAEAGIEDLEPQPALQTRRCFHIA
jgi:hypothetical protein